MARARSDSPLLFEVVERPTFRTERKAIAAGQWPVAGLDEAGRGPLAGPVVAAAVILNPKRIPKGLDDSKRLAAEEREKLVFRAKLQVDPKLLAKYHRQVKTGVRGLGFVRTSPSAKWPDSLAVKLP